MGTDLQALAEWTPKVVEAVRQVPGIVDVTSDREPGGPQAYVDIDRTNAARLGVSMRAIDAALNDAFSERQISTLYGDRNQYKVILEVDPALQRRAGRSLTDLGDERARRGNPACRQSRP